MDDSILAREINEFMKDADPYEYNDTVDDELQFIVEIYESIRNNDTEVIKEYLKDFIEEGGIETDIQKANELLKELKKVSEHYMIYSSNIDDIKNELNYHQTLLNTTIKNENYDTAYREAEIVSRLTFLLNYLSNK